MFSLKRWRRKRKPDGELGDKERAENNRWRADSDSLFPGYGQTSTRGWRNRIDSQFKPPR
jgi:hypothetical protein